jgi:hypothetical protein
MTKTSLCGAWLYWFQSPASKHYRSAKPYRPLDGLNWNLNEKAQTSAKLRTAVRYVELSTSSSGELCDATGTKSNDWMVNWKGSEKKRLWPDTVFLNFPWKDWRIVRKPQGNDSRKNRTGYLPNTSLQHHQHTNVFTCNKCSEHRFRFPRRLAQSD